MAPSTEPTQPAKATKAVKAAKATKVAKATKAAKTTKAAKATKTAEATKAANPKVAQATKVASATKASGTAKATKTAGAAKTAKTAKTAKAAKSAATKAGGARKASPVAKVAKAGKATKATKAGGTAKAVEAARAAEAATSTGPATTPGVTAADIGTTADTTPPVPDDASAGPAEAGAATRRRFEFAFEARMRPTAAAFGVLPATAHVEVDGGELRVRFGPWSLRTPVANVVSTEVTGPYRWWKVAGSARVSLADRGVTFATTTRAGLCIRFRDPVPAALPRGLLQHRSATVTVADPAALADALATAAAES